VVYDYMVNRSTSTNLQVGQFSSALSWSASLDGDFYEQRKGKHAGRAQSGKIDRTTANIGDHLATFFVSRMRLKKKKECCKAYLLLIILPLRC
jgi:hypothetical protein